MKIDTLFDIDQTVIITAIKQPAHITEICMVGNNLNYTLEYWWNGEIKTVHLNQWELAALKPAENQQPKRT